MGSENGFNGKTENCITYRNAKSEKPKKEEKHLATKQEEVKEFQFGLGRCGTFLFLGLLKVIVTLIVISCLKGHTTLQLPTFPTDLTSYIDFEGYSIYLGWLFFQVFLSIVCPGKMVKGKPLKNGHQLLYKLNGFKMFTINFCIMLGLQWSGMHLDILVEKMPAFYCVSLICTVVISVLLYVTSRSRSMSSSRLNSHASGGDSLHDAFVGRELNPRIKSFDIKSFMIQLCYLQMAAFNFITLLHGIQPSNEKSSSVFLCSMILMGFAGENLFFEESSLISRTFTSAGVGFKLVYGCLVFIPFMSILPQRYIQVNQVTQNLVIPRESFLLFLPLVGGYFIYRFSELEKHTFYWYPNHEDFAEMEVISSENGENLLVGGWWGWARHPNYLGFIIICTTVTAATEFNSILPYLLTIIFTIYVMHRIYHEEKRSQKKYGKAWDQYCDKVKYRLLKYIY